MINAKSVGGVTLNSHVDRNIIVGHKAAFIRWCAAQEPVQQYVKGSSPKRVDVVLVSPKVATGYDSALAEAVSARIAELKLCADEEGIAWSFEAEKQLWNFLEALDSPSRPALAVDQNGDLRALWSNLIQEQVGVRFRGDVEASAVLFAKTERGMRRETLKADLVTIVALIREMKLIHVTRG